MFDGLQMRDAGDAPSSTSAVGAPTPPPPPPPPAEEDGLSTGTPVVSNVTKSPAVADSTETTTATSTAAASDTDPETVVVVVEKDDDAPIEDDAPAASSSAPVTNPDACLRILRKYRERSRPRGGAGGLLSALGLSGGRARDGDGLRALGDALDRVDDDDRDGVAREALTAFASIVAADDDPAAERARVDAAQSLVAHGCLDGFVVVGASEPAVDALAASVLGPSSTTDPAAELSAVKFLLTAGCRVVEGEASLRGASLLRAVRACYHVYLRTTDPANRIAARAALRQLVADAFLRTRRGRRERRPTTLSAAEETDDKKTTGLVFDSPDHRDAFLVLRSLCKLSSKELPDDAVDRRETDPSAPADPALESKVLALELLHYVLSNPDCPLYDDAPDDDAPPAAFRFAVRHYLCASLLKNCTSSVSRVVGLALRVFAPLVTRLRSHLKTEIECLVANVFLVILDSPHAPPEHKDDVVALFGEVCADPDALADVFLNYDCDLDAVDLFRRIVDALARAARSGDAEAERAGGERAERSRRRHRRLRLNAMRALEQVLRSLHASVEGDVDDDEREKETPEAGRGGESSSAAASSSPAKQQQQEEADATSAALVAAYDSKRRLREERDEVLHVFNHRSPSKGVRRAGELGHLDPEDPADVARWLRSDDRLDRTQIGEYLGKDADGFGLAVLHAYAGLSEFGGMDFDDAIRYYLSGFRLPGEAQKIDRIMEKFAERYCEGNPDVFPSADAAFILAFAVIMLNTDLHNPSIKEERKMTKESFVRMNRGICDGGDLPDEMLEAVFERIRTNPISLKEDDEARERAAAEEAGAAGEGGLAMFGVTTTNYDEVDRAREDKYNQERDRIVRTTESLFRRRRRAGRRRSSDAGASRRDGGVAARRFVRGRDAGLRDAYVAPMLEVTWGPALAVFSTALAAADGASIEDEDAARDALDAVESCVAAFRYAVLVAAACGNDVARGAFARALANFSGLGGGGGGGARLGHRHVRCAETLTGMAVRDGESLGNAWEHVFRTLTEIDRLKRVHESRRRTTDDESEEDDSVDQSEEDDVSVDDDSADGPADRRSIDEANARVVHEIVPDELVDAVYHRSSSLSAAAAKDFVLQLCRVSRMEISGYGGHVGSRANQVVLDETDHADAVVNQPVIYSLQKLVEVAHYNMDSRPVLVFADLWSVVAGHLTSTALHSNAAVAMYAVDTLRQLCVQFLSREERGVFQFQRRFLKPLPTIMARSVHVDTKELLLGCVERIVVLFGTDDADGRPGTLRSGWRPVLAALGVVGRDADDGVAETGFRMLDDLLARAKQKGDASRLTSEHFVDLVDAYAAHAAGRRLRPSLVSIDRLVELGDALARRDAPSSSSGTRRSDGGPAGDDDDDDDAPGLEHWWPVLLGLSKSVGDERRAVREKALRSLFDLVHRHFFTADEKETTTTERNDEPHRDLQTLQLIFRGVLIPILEHAESDADALSRTYPLPDDFSHFVTHAAPPRRRDDDDDEDDADDVLVNDDDVSDNGWITTTLDPLLDGCVDLCLRSSAVHGSDALVEEVLAVLNSCLLSDSGALAVAGLRRTRRFVRKDLAEVTDDTWAVVCHMLRRCMSVRGSAEAAEAATRLRADDDRYDGRDADEAVLREFVADEDLSAERRYVRSNAAMVVGTLLCEKDPARRPGTRWFLFLMRGLGDGIRDWENAARVVGLRAEDGRPPTAKAGEYSPPHHLENAVYGRKWMTCLILLLVRIDKEDDESAAAAKPRRALLREQTQAIVTTFIEKESRLGEKTAAAASSTEELVLEACRAGEVGHMTNIVCDLLEGYNKFDDAYLFDLAWLCPMLSELIQSNNRAVRVAVHGLVSRMFEGPLSSRLKSV